MNVLGPAPTIGTISGGTSSATLGSAVFSNSNGVSFGLSGQTITASHNALTNQTVQTQNVVVPAAAGNTYTSGTVIFSASTNLTISTNGQTILFSAAPGGAGNTGSISAGTTNATLGQVVFSNSNGVSFGVNGQTVTASHNGLTSQSNQAVSAANGSFTFQTLSLANSNGVSFSTGTQGVFATVRTDYLTTQTNPALSAANGSFTFQTATFANSNGVSFSTGTQGIFATVRTDYLTSQSNQALSAANGSFTFQTATFANSNGVSFSTGTQGIYATVQTNYLTSQTNQTAGLYAVGNTTQSSSGTQDARSLSFRGEGVASVGVSNGSVVVSVPAGGGGLTNINVSAGTTSNNLSNIVFSNSNNVSFGLNGSTITATVTVAGGAAPGFSYWDNYQALGNITRGVRMGQTYYQTRPLFIPVRIDGTGLNASRVRFLIERSAGVSLNMTYGVGIYTYANSTSAALAASTTNAISLTASSQWSGIRVLDVTGLNTYTLPQGPVLIALLWSGSNNSTAVMDFNLYGANRPAVAGFVFAGTNSTGATASQSIIFPFYGAYSAGTAGFPSNVGTADVNHATTVAQAIQIHGANL